MNRTVLTIVAAAAAALPAGPLRAAPAQSVSGVDTAILKPLTLLKKKNLDFGVIFRSATAGTVTIDPATGTVTTTGGLLRGPQPTSAAEFIGAGTRRAPVILRVPKNPITLTRVGGTQTMTVSNFTLSTPQTIHVNPFEVFDFKVGGRLNVGANQAEGVYEGTFTVTATYQ
ncbi:DUF4402 domain-containing protein [Sphingomonas sabuli]|uniref:DUF4402 domain-containing protein n=1 Tax=Sphingomonas sabuli TaxID=2764186 RepID=A0A7G9L0B4_9SPHN|nr:DUF4402 domain-containing protein [Sphingomonas sabuli]QNM82063.1 DUF4402 domain-containing protein [Sphingomonas sabuli]